MSTIAYTNYFTSLPPLKIRDANGALIDAPPAIVDGVPQTAATAFLRARYFKFGDAAKLVALVDKVPGITVSDPQPNSIMTADPGETRTYFSIAVTDASGTTVIELGTIFGLANSPETLQPDPFAITGTYNWDAANKVFTYTPPVVVPAAPAPAPAVTAQGQNAFAAAVAAPSGTSVLDPITGAYLRSILALAQEALNR